MSAVILDAGALIGVDRGDRELLAMLEAAIQDDRDLVTSVGAVAQSWRGGPRQALLARWLATVRIMPIDDTTAREIGGLLARDGSGDVVDAHVSMLAAPDDTVITSDVDDLLRLLTTRQVEAAVARA